MSIKAENSRETESLLDNIRELEKSLKLKEMVIHKLIPIEMQELIKNQVAWNEMMGEWQLRGIGNRLTLYNFSMLKFILYRYL